MKIWRTRSAHVGRLLRAHLASGVKCSLLLVSSALTASTGATPPEYITEVRITAPSQLVVNATVPVTVQFLDSGGRVVAPEPGRNIQISPSGIYPCSSSRCSGDEYSEVFVTQPGQAVYQFHLRSVVPGFNAMTVTHPNGSSSRATFQSVAADSSGSGFGDGVTPPNASESSTPSKFALATGNLMLSQGVCTKVQIDLQDRDGNSTPLSNPRDIKLNPGGGVHPSIDECNSYRNDPVTIAAGQDSFSFYAYVVQAYEGFGVITLSASGFDELRVPFATTGEAMTPPVIPPEEPPVTDPPVVIPPVVLPPAPNLGDIAVWANDGGEKIIQEETRSFTRDTRNRLWDGTTIRTFGARNEVISFAVVVDNRGTDLTNVRVDFDRLGSEDYVLATTQSSAASVFDWRNRPIEVFPVGYLKVHGLSRIAYELYDETHTPEKFRRPYQDGQPDGPAIGSGTWFDRPHHNKSYPDIAIPQEVQPSTAVRSGNSQSFWVDVYLPKDTPAGVLRGNLRVTNNSEAIVSLPVEVRVVDFTLDDESKAKSMVFLGDVDIAERYFTGPGAAALLPKTSYADYRRVIDRHFMLAWRHHVSLIDSNALVAFSITPTNAPNEDWQRRLRGELYTEANGYVGPGANLEHDVFSIGTYSNWLPWWGLTSFDPTHPNYDSSASRETLTESLNSNTNQWENWFRNNAPDTKRFLYVDDEPAFTASRAPNFSALDFANLVSKIVKDNPGPGGNLPTFITASPLHYEDELPHTSILADSIAQGETALWSAATNAINAEPDREYFMYNGRRPASGTFIIEDDGIALRELPWGQYKKGIDRWFYWQSTYYNNFQGGPSARDLNNVDPDGVNYRLGTQTNVFKSAHTFGGHTRFDPAFGESGWNYSNGDGVLFYPGTDLVFPEESKGLQGPMASLRLKHWRRGLQDVIYLEQAMARDPNATQAIIDEMVPEAMWELGVTNPQDPTYVHKPPSWSNNPDDWEEARRRLANIILGYEAL